ncbi:MAG: hypothetical protein LC789_06505 [Actinobacteria bacterium]|nr:hypothetical protein [Actinomycetota bacterium]
MLVSVHFPKAGGTATKNLLAAAYGEALLLDYTDPAGDPTSTRHVDPDRFFRQPQPLPAGVGAVHGHFHPLKYGELDAAWVTVLRHPVDTIISLYWFWRAMTVDDNPLHHYFLRAQLTVEELARLPLLRRLMSDTYFAHVDMRRFDLIGRHDARREFVERLERLLGTPLPPDQPANVTPGQENLRAMLADHPLRRRLQDILADDVRFYEEWAH